MIFQFSFFNFQFTMPGGKRQSLYSAHVLIISAKRLDKRILAKGMKASLGRMFSANRSSFS